MPIKMSKFVDIKSGISNIRTAIEKELIPRIFTNSADMTEDVIECENLEEVADIFATSSDEYKIASKYFGFINKYARSPRKISFAKMETEARYATVRNSVELTNDNVDEIIGLMLSGTPVISLSINDGASIDVSVANFSAPPPETIDDCGASLVTRINTALTGADIPITCSYAGGIFTFTATSYDVKSFVLSNNVAEVIDVDNNSNPIKIKGHTARSYNQVFKAIYQENNNFGSFVFLGVTDATELATLANYVKQNYPSEFLDVIPVTSENYSTIQSAVANIDGVSLELCGTTDDTGKFNFVLPMAITATTDYNKENGTVNYMFTQDGNMSVVVDDDTEAEQYDTAKVNYYGRTQQAGQKLAFYQDGVLQGNYQDQSIFVNEIWLKDALTTKFINYMLLTPNWYRNTAPATGNGLITNVIDRAKLNGTITTEKEITEEDKTYIYNVTSDDNAWREIYQFGYWIKTWVEEKVINRHKKYIFKYLLLYSKGDSINKVEGQNVLI